jgi:hypothetical protein
VGITGAAGMTWGRFPTWTGWRQVVDAVGSERSDSDSRDHVPEASGWPPSTSSLEVSARNAQEPPAALDALGMMSRSRDAPHTPVMPRQPQSAWLRRSQPPHRRR